MGAGGDTATPRCTQRERTERSSAVRSPHTASSFLADPELFQGVFCAVDIEAGLQDSVTRSISEASAIPAAGALENGLQDLLSRFFSETSLLLVPSRTAYRTWFPVAFPAFPRLLCCRCLPGTTAALAHLELFPGISPASSHNTSDMEQTPPSVPKLAWLEEEEEAGATSAQQPEELEQFQLLQEDAAKDRTQEQKPARGCFRRTAQMICEFITCVWQEETTGVGTGVLANFHLFSAETSAAMLDLLVEKGVSNPKQVPAMVRYIHRWLTANGSAGHRLDKALLELTKEYPSDVLITLLRWAPSCDRAAMTMWGTIMSSSRTAEPALQILLHVLSAWPVDSVYTSDGDSTGVFALAATMTLWRVFNLTWCPPVVLEYFPSLFLRLLFQAYISTLDISEEVDTFWKGCQEQHGLAANPNSFALQTLKALLCRMRYEHVVVAMERKCAWDTLLCADSHHYAVGLLAREMRRVSIIWCCSIASCLFDLLSQDISDWELPALAFLVEVLDCLDLNECGENVLQIMTRHLQSKSRQVRRLALRGLVVLSKDPSMNKRMYSLTESLGNLLWDADEDIVEMAVAVLGFLLLQKDLAIASPVALQLAEALWQLFDNDNSLVQLLSVRLFQELMKLVVAKGKKPLKKRVSKSLLPLFFNCHDENQRVAQASRETLLSAVKFLKRRDLQHLVKTDQMWSFAECLLAEDRSRAAEHLRLALPYLQSPQEPLREAAVRFIGLAGRYLRGKQQEFRIICRALQDMMDDISPAISCLALQTLYINLAVQSIPSSRPRDMHDQLRRLWRSWPFLRRCGWLSCCSAVEN
ncbi:maestro heat-like repeat-containing protein family member 6 [Vidua chalybeata]|uniref:maestro heat-like repeat-containing protein family member 6 n=1 Tax=Vidua chalybeata TaxID=81927 RepID=UPI0023A87AC2|nr:maestro heat-like repeat-containing protein family member 6 [Vidua chalybeata]XP_053803797.1 maestro heat-like repeat-containing protein family member 6 [Vidua chalybeata]XP_053803798.1 maestro heat-like repeat-containing protein family member 6 [Vidua chalybeata]